MDGGKSRSTIPCLTGGRASGEQLEGEIVVAQSRSIGDRAPISPQRDGEVEGAVDDFRGALGDGIAVGTHPSGFVAE